MLEGGSMVIGELEELFVGSPVCAAGGAQQGPPFSIMAEFSASAVAPTAAGAGETAGGGDDGQRPESPPADVDMACSSEEKAVEGDQLRAGASSAACGLSEGKGAATLRGSSSVQRSTDSFATADVDLDALAQVRALTGAAKALRGGDAWAEAEATRVTQKAERLLKEIESRRPAS